VVCGSYHDVKALALGQWFNIESLVVAFETSFDLQRVNEDNLLNQKKEVKDKKLLSPIFHWLSYSAAADCWYISRLWCANMLWVGPYFHFFLFFTFLQKPNRGPRPKLGRRKIFTWKKAKFQRNILKGFGGRGILDIQNGYPTLYFYSMIHVIYRLTHYWVWAAWRCWGRTFGPKILFSSIGFTARAALR